MYRFGMVERSGGKPGRTSTGAKRKRAEPVAAPDEAPAAPTRRRTPVKARAQRQSAPTVLVVDDDAEVREWLRLSLSLRGWVVEEAETGDDALGRIEALEPDVVLLDHQMPGMKGIECAAKLRAGSDDLRIIMASALIDASLTKQARELHILPIEKSDHARLFDLFELLAEQVQSTRAPVA